MNCKNSKNKTMPFILRKKVDAYITHTLEVLNWLSIQPRIKFMSLKWIFLIKNVEMSDYLSNEIPWISYKRNSHDLNLTNKSDVIPRIRNGRDKLSLFYYGLKLFEELRWDQ